MSKLLEALGASNEEEALDVIEKLKHPGVSILITWSPAYGMGMSTVGPITPRLGEELTNLAYREFVAAGAQARAQGEEHSHEGENSPS
jgi:hypothetical protein